MLMTPGGFGRRHRRGRVPAFRALSCPALPAGAALADQPPGTTWRIRALHGQGAIRQRLLDLGFVPGSTVTILRRAPLGDPLEIGLGESFVAIRRAEAARIEVTHAA